MSEITTLRKKVDTLLARLEQQRKPREMPETDMIVIYDPATGEPLPGYELTPENSHFRYGGVWLPKKLYLVPAGETIEDGIDP